METCDIHVDTAGFPGTTRACFEKYLLEELRGSPSSLVRRYLSLEEVDDYADHLLAPGIQSGAEAIVSGDLDLREATGLPAEVLTPRDALAPSVDNRSQARGQADAPGRPLPRTRHAERRWRVLCAGIFPPRS